MKKLWIVAVLWAWGCQKAVPVEETSASSSPAEQQEPVKTDQVERVATISTGDEVDIEDHLDEKDWTVVEFGAEW